MMQIADYYKAQTLQAAYEKLKDDKNNTVIGGGLWLKQVGKPIKTVIDLSALNLNQITEDAQYFKVGAFVTLGQLHATKKLHDVTDNLLKISLENIMGVAFRNMATLGGSIMGRFAFSDLIPALLVLQAELEFYHAGRMTLNAFIENKKLDKDVLLQVLIPKTEGKAYFKKVSNTVLDFSILNLAIYKTDQICIAVGARPGIAQLVTPMMHYLNSAEISEDTISKAIQIGLETVTLSDNQRAQKSYREQLLKTYLKRGLKEVMKHDN